MLIGRPPATLRDPRYLAVLAAAGLIVLLAHPWLERAHRAIDVLDAAGPGLFCVTGASIALRYRLAAPEAVVLGASSGIGGGVVRDVLLGEAPRVLRGGLYAVPALVGSTVAVTAARGGEHDVLFAVLGVVSCVARELRRHPPGGAAPGP